MNSVLSTAIIFNYLLQPLNDMPTFIFQQVRFTLYIVLVCLSTTACTNLFFYPQENLLRTPEQLRTAYQDIYVTTEDNFRLHGWHLTVENPRGIVFYLHGNAENISTHIENIYWVTDYDYEVVALDYRGYGLSEGKADFPDVFLDIDAFFNWTTDYASSKSLPITIVGQSLGAAITTYYFGSLTSKQHLQLNGIVLDSVFSGQRDIVNSILSKTWITKPIQIVVPLLLPKKYDPKNWVEALSPVPILFFHSPEDNIIPYKHGLTVFNRAKDPKYWVPSSGAHITSLRRPMYQNILVNFIEQPQRDPTEYNFQQHPVRYRSYHQWQQERN